MVEYMKAVVIEAPGVIKMLEVPKPAIRPDYALIKVAYSGICGTDLAILKGDMSAIRNGSIKYPVRIGHEWSGVVCETGANVRCLNPGDRVVSDSGTECGECPACINGRHELCKDWRSLGTINAWDGSFAEYMLMPEWRLHKLPDNVGLEEAALSEPASIAYNGVKKAEINKNSLVLVVGTGPIGLAAVRLAKIEGAAKVLLAGRKDQKLDAGKIMGADATVNVTKGSLKDFVMSQTDGAGANAIIEATGDAGALVSCLELCSFGCAISLISFYEKPLDGFDVDKLVLSAAALKGVAGDAGTLPQVIRLMSEKALDISPLITHRLGFGEMIEAMKNARGSNEGKIKMLVRM